MTALFIPRLAKEKSLAWATLFSLVFWIYPEIGLGASLQSIEGQNQPLIFEVKNLNLQSTNQSLRLIDVTANDPLVNNLKIYLAKHGSPMAEEAAELIKYDEWQRSLAIAFVESNFCKTAKDKNCSSIGVAPGHRLWRKYDTYASWMADMSALMQKPLYQKLNTFKKMKGVYVQPGSQKWVIGAQKKYDELMKLTEESKIQRQLIAQKQAEKFALTTFPLSSNLE